MFGRRSSAGVNLRVVEIHGEYPCPLGRRTYPVLLSNAQPQPIRQQEQYSSISADQTDTAAVWFAWGIFAGWRTIVELHLDYQKQKDVMLATVLLAVQALRAATHVGH